MALFGIGLQAFKAEQEKGASALSFESTGTTQTHIENLKKDPKVSSATKVALEASSIDMRGAKQGLDLIKVAEAPKEARPLRVTQQASTSDSVYKLLSPLVGSYREEKKGIFPTGKKQPDNVPFKHGAINPAKDVGPINVNKLKQDLADKESFGGRYDLASKVSTATGKY